MATTKRKLIEVALPLEAINRESAREKSIRHGHPSTLHLWWARRPLAACRAVIFASLVDDPSSHPEQFPTPELQEAERQRLFRLIEELVKWENTTNERVLDAAREEIRRSTDGKLPPLLDPFAGGGSIPLEAQRLGLEAHASDLNPVAVLINKALIEIPPKFADQPPVHPDARDGMGTSGSWKGAAGLAEDIRRYGAWMRDEAERRIGHLYPKVALPPEHGGGEATVIAWLWARTVKCPNPACGAEMPLVASWELARKPGRVIWLQPRLDPAKKDFRLKINLGGKPAASPKTGRGASFTCLFCGQVAPDAHVKAAGVGRTMGYRPTATVVDGPRGRVYRAADDMSVPATLEPSWIPDIPIAVNPRDIRAQLYGLNLFSDLFLPRQLSVLGALTDIVRELRPRIDGDASLVGAGEGYADAVVTYLAFVVDRVAMSANTLVRWNPVGEKAQHAFGRQALPMVWDFAETNPFGSSTGSIAAAIELTAGPLVGLAGRQGRVGHSDARTDNWEVADPVISTDPPYYDNIAYADLSDFFYVWLRRCLAGVYPDLFATVTTPKADELIADPRRFSGDGDAADLFFETGLRQSLANLASASAALPMTVFYAYRQAEGRADGETASTGWELMLKGLLDAGLVINGTWPLRTEMATRQTAMGANALASSIVIVARTRGDRTGITDRKAFLAELRSELPEALRLLQHGNIAPVDLAQASIGPGMAVFSKYAKVVEPSGEPMTVRTALGLINQVLSEVLTEQEDDFDADTRWAITWFEQHRFGEGKYGDADVVARAKDVGVNGLVEAGIIESRAGKVRLLRSEELKPDWDPATDRRTPIWEITQRLIHALKEGGGAEAAADIVRRTGGRAEVAKELAYRLYVTCERKNWADQARDFNSLVVEWPEITKLASGMGPGQTDLGLGG